MVTAGFCIWITGLPQSGKTTLAQTLEKMLAERGVPVQILDSDEIRKVLTPRPAYTEDERQWFYHALAWIAQLLTRNGVNVIVAATAHRRSYREQARWMIPRFLEVYLDCCLDTCRKRDQKGLFERADKGEISTLPGVGVPYEPPERPEVAMDSERLSPEEGARQVLARLEELGYLQNRREPA